MSPRTIAVGAAAVAALGVLGFGVVNAASDDRPDETAELLEFEVAEDATRFVFDDAPVFDDGLPAYGNPFVTQGYIYEPGTLADGGGVNPDGSPTHPDAVIGTWTCEGFLIGDGARTESGPWVISTQVFDFGEFDGDDIVISHGIETPVVGEDVQRAIIGGTGEHAGAVGTQTQTLEAFNDSEGVNLTVTLEPAES
ncbi:MAG: hypothetical protein QNJ12_09275 [Ilumatobacter sp.]|uniref:hypothetical protein n=1 Tax=Ilumatobacter sp. TaxID=1967498 RepID=UPI00261EEC69|nr:hypothetical protein [Ilumatobacter sp.]MDJ0768974.1 hypothetical protein [Ilumatobacter sp.]